MNSSKESIPENGNQPNQGGSSEKKTYNHIKSNHQDRLDCKQENSDLKEKEFEKNGQENSTLSPSTSSSPDSEKENNNQLHRNSPKSPDKRHNKKITTS